MTADDVRELWFAIQRIKDELERIRRDQATVQRHLADAQQRLTRLEGQ